MQVTYLAHDLDDPSCWRRVEMLRRGGAMVRVAGFRRGRGPLPEAAIVLGHTANGRMMHRIRAIVAAAPCMARLIPTPAGQAGAWSGGIAPTETILARNLEMLVLGAALLRSRRHSPAQTGVPRLAYELLDVHGLMLGSGVVHRVLRRIEATLMRKARLVVLSSPAFATRYLQAYGQPNIPTLLIENKPFARDATTTVAVASGRDVRPLSGQYQVGQGSEPNSLMDGGSLVVGWFGMLRCAWSLHTLDAVTRAQPGCIRVVLRGRPALDAIPDFHDVIDANPDLTFHGPYHWPDDLPAIYGGIDVAWLIDRYQAGQNSDWLLPNRLYEGCLNGAAPMVLAGTEVARRTEAWGCSLCVAAPDVVAVQGALTGIDAPVLARSRAAVAAIPRAALRMDDDECRRLTDAICGLEGQTMRLEAVPTRADVAAVADQASAADPAQTALPRPQVCAAKTISVDAAHGAGCADRTIPDPDPDLDADPHGANGRVLVVIPTLNEAAHIAGVLAAILPFAQSVGGLVVVADGGSQDGTRDIVEAAAAHNPRVVLLDNPRRLQAAGVNLSVETFGAGSDWLLRLDAHSAYPLDFGAALLAEAQATGADSVVVPMQAEGQGRLQRLIAEAQNSRIGNGGSAHRLQGQGAWVDHGHHALMRIAAFRRVGGYDESFSHNEDAELDHRLRHAGYRIRLTGRTGLRYFPRARLGPLLRQYFNFGRGRARNLAKHRGRPALRQGVVGMLAPALMLVPLGGIFALPLLLWVAACFAGGAMIAVTMRNPAGLLAGFIAGAMHLAWSAGYWRERLSPAPRIEQRATA